MTMMKMREKKSASRGYTMVEIAIVLVVIGIAFGGALVPVFSRLEVENQASVKDAMRQIKLAMLDYAGRQRTVARWVENRGAVYRLPAGRPYLPCPDVNGNGVEDRTAFPIDNLTRPIDFSEVSRSPPGTSSPGGCVDYKGTVPWRTLNLPQYSADWWGREYTYRVDPAYANALIGFNQSTVADKYDLRRELLMSGSNAEYQERSGNGTSPPPGVICGANPNRAVTRVAFPCDPGTTNVLVIAGDFATANITFASRPFRPYDEDDIISGVPAVIVSHGPNGHGGVLGEGAPETSGGRQVVCTPFPDSTRVFNAERQNAFRENFSATPTTVACPQIILSGISDGVESSFYAGPHSESDGLVFDDIVVWISADELAGEMSRVGVFPAADFPRIGLE